MLFNMPLVMAFIGYLLVTMIIGFLAYRATTSFSDYILGDRKLGPITTALSVCASDMSGWLLLALPGAIYLTGLNQIWLGVGLFIGSFASWQLMAKRLRIYTAKAQDALTIPDYLEKRLEDSTGIIRLVSASAILIFFVFYTASGLVGGALLFSEVFGLPYFYALLTGSLVIIVYTFAGGFLAVSWTDTFQGLLMLIALLLLPIATFVTTDNFNVSFTHVVEKQPDMLNIFHDITPIALFSFLAWGLGYAGQPHILTRFMAIEDPKHIRISRNIAISWQALSLCGSCLIGLCGAIFYFDQPLKSPETVFIQLSNAIFNPWIAGLLIAAIMAAIMSTIDSQLLVCSSAVSEDFYKRWLKPNASERELILVSRLAILLVALAAISFATDPNSQILSLVSYAWAGLGATFGPVILISLYWHGLTRNGALAGIVTGALTVMIWSNQTGGIFELYELLPGFIFNTLVTFVISKCDRKKPSDNTLNIFRSMKSEI